MSVYIYREREIFEDVNRTTSVFFLLGSVLMSLNVAIISPNSGDKERNKRKKIERTVGQLRRRRCSRRRHRHRRRWRRQH